MNALPSLDPSTYPPKRRKHRSGRSMSSNKTVAANTAAADETAAPRPRSRPKSNPAYAHRRQGLELITKSVAYSILSVFGVVTLVDDDFIHVNQFGCITGSKFIAIHLHTTAHHMHIRATRPGNRQHG